MSLFGEFIGLEHLRNRKGLYLQLQNNSYELESLRLQPRFEEEVWLKEANTQVLRSH